MKEIDVGQTLSAKYTLLRLLGAGAMGQVWVARHLALQQTFAVKVLQPLHGGARGAASSDHESPETTLTRFENEARLAAALSRKSRHIATVTDYGIDEGTAYLVMELLTGEGLEQRAGEGRRLAPAEVSAVVTQMARGLAVAHAEGVMHRDLKPANVFLTHDEEGALVVKLLDFGIARMGSAPHARAATRLTMKGLVLGSPGYMSPEHAMAESPDTRSDVWALAVVAFEALTGTNPFEADDADETIERICNFRWTRLPVAMPEAAEGLSAVFERAFARRLGDRFQTATDFATALAANLPPAATRITGVRSPSTTAFRWETRAAPAAGRSWLVSLAVGLGVGAIAVGAFFALRPPRAVASASPPTPPSLVPPPPPTQPTLTLVTANPVTATPVTATTGTATTGTSASSRGNGKAKPPPVRLEPSTSSARPPDPLPTDRSEVF